MRVGNCCGISVLSWLVSMLLLALALPGTALAGPEPYHDYFADDYRQARDRFIAASRQTGARLVSYLHPLAGPDGMPLYTDVALLGPEDANTVLALASATHGVEGFAGSAIQVGLLREGLASQLPPDVRLIMIHAINPYGFAYLRRVNEANVDLNRSFVNHALPYPENPDYVAVARLLEPDSLSFWENAKARVKLYWYVLSEGKPALKRAISQGQYTHPKGLFFGGHSDTWSGRTMRAIATEHLAHARRLVFIDVHTGLGKFAAAELIMNVPEDSPSFLNARQCWGERVKSTVEGGSVSVDIRGSLKRALPEMLPGTAVTAASLEFGSYPVEDVFWALRAENWLHHRAGEGAPVLARIKADLREVFYPDADTWRRAVWEQGRAVVIESLRCLQP